jgi:hypothetical protein
MATKIIFNTDKKLKVAAMKKSKESGLTLSAFLNLAMQGFVSEQLQIGIIDKELAAARDDIQKGRVTKQEDVFREHGI